MREQDRPILWSYAMARRCENAALAKPPAPKNTLTRRIYSSPCRAPDPDPRGGCVVMTKPSFMRFVLLHSIYVDYSEQEVRATGTKSKKTIRLSATPIIATTADPNAYLGLLHAGTWLSRCVLKLHPPPMCLRCVHQRCLSPHRRHKLHYHQCRRAAC